MRKKELLSPAGDYESLLQAVHNGADAVYLSGKRFGARAYAPNFTDEELVKAIKYCHLYGVKIYVTVNTMIYEREIEECINYIRFLHQSNVDAVIMQDLGLIKIVREKFPNLEIHASTGMHNHNKEQLKMYEKIGIKRVVLARELTLDEINQLDTSLELEEFIHGALCISYSGQCLFSSLLMNRSGNRGSCAGICRLPFKLYEEDKEITTNGEYLLSPKEFSTLKNFEKVMESNIYSLKIEGRMKSPYYVGFVTRLYRKLIDDYNQGKPLEIKEEDIKKLKVLYNRGFTKGHLFGDKNEDLMNIKQPNHQGIIVGEVLEVTNKKIKIKLSDDLAQEDGIRFTKEEKGMIVNFLYNEKGLLINKAKKNDIVFVDNKIGLKKSGKVLKTIDRMLEKELAILPEKKIDINCAVIAKIDKKFSVAFSDGVEKIAKKRDIVSIAKTSPMSEDTIKEKLCSLGNTPFHIKHIEIIKDDNIFINMSELKKIRRELVEELIKKREERIPHVFIECEIKKKEHKEALEEKIKFHVLARTKEQIEVCLSNKVDSIYITDKKLYEEYKNYKNTYLKLERVQTNFPDYKGEKLLVSEIGSIHKYVKENEVITDYPLNTANSYSFNFLERLGAKRVTLSVEAKKEDIQSIVDAIINKSKLEVYLYGKPEVMVMKYCPLNMFVNKNEHCIVCKNNKKYYLKDRNGKLYCILNEVGDKHLTHLFYYKNMNRINDLNDYKKMGIQNFRIELLEETKEEVENIFRKVKNVKF